MQLLLDATEREAFPTSMRILGISSQEAANLIYYRLNLSLDEILSEAQSKVWQGLVDNGGGKGREIVFIPEAGIKNKKVDVKRRFVFIEPEVKIEGADAVGKIDVEDLEIIPDLLDEQHWIEINTDATVSEEQMKQIAEAKLIAHTELLGPLDERAARRLALVVKGVVQQYFEVQDEHRERMLERFEADFRQRIEAGEMDPEHAAVRLQMMRKELWDKGDPNERGESSASDITKDLLYQQTIKDVLSEEAFAQYNAHQAEREAFRLQALRDVAVACMDTQLLLDDIQRKRLETAASGLAPVPFSGNRPAEFMFFQLFQRQTNSEILTSWQQGEFERIFGNRLR